MTIDMYENGFLDPAYITPEEQQILDGNIAVQKNLYTSKQDFVVESDKFLKHSEDDITLRRHTRFVDFPKHKHDYVEIFYCLSGSVTHVINEEEICLRPGELLFMNQHIEHAVIACGQEDLGINIIIRPAYFQNILTLINKDNILADFIINALEGDSCVSICTLPSPTIPASRTSSTMRSSFCYSSLRTGISSRNTPLPCCSCIS